MIEPWSVAVILVAIISLGFPLVRKASAALSIAIGLFVIFVLELAAVSFDPYRYESPIIMNLGFSPLDLLSGSFAYTMITSVFIHADYFIQHILFNAIVLAFLGMMLEDRIGTPKFITIFLISGVCGNLAFGLANFGLPIIAIGASGAIAGILGALLAMFPNERVTLIPLPIRDLQIWMLVLIFLALQLVFVLMSGTGIAWEAHVGGLAGGMATAYVIARIGKRELKDTSVGLDMHLLGESHEIAEIIARIDSESIPEVKEVWLKEIAAKAKCPLCNGSLRVDRGGLGCDSGHRFRTREP